MNVLIVDDEVTFRLVVNDYLVDGGFTVFLAENGEEGMAKLKEEKIDIVISDLHMHVMDGIKFCRTARAIPRFQDIPFLFVSAYGDEETVALINSPPKAAFLSKTRPMNELIQAIHHLAMPKDPVVEVSQAAEPPVLTTHEVRSIKDSTGDPKSERPILERPRTLVVDDDDALRMLLSDMLLKEGHDVTAASDGQEAIELLQSQRFDLVLLDIVMPRISGFGVLMFIKENITSTKVIMLTAYADLKLAVECKEFGAADFIGKPFMRSDLLNTIKHILS